MSRPDPLVANLVRFGRYLRARGLAVAPRTSADLVDAAAMVGLEDRRDLYFAFRAVTLSRPEERPAFDEAFELFFGMGARSDVPRTREELLEVKEAGKIPATTVETLADEGVGESEGSGWSSVERLERRDFAEMSREEVVDARRLMARMVWQPNLRRTRRGSPSQWPGSPDLGRTLRRLIGHEGPMMPLVFSQRRLRPRPLLVLADVSGSMEQYTEMLLRFIHAARGRIGRIEAFVFATRLTRVTSEMRGRDPNLVLEKVARVVEDWSGGTRIGEVLRTFNRDWNRRVTGRGPVALIISDGWDRGNAAILRVEMARFARSVYRVVWLNPRSGSDGYRPEVRGMRTVLPFVDDFLPAANLVDLAQVVALLESTSRRTPHRIRS